MLKVSEFKSHIFFFFNYFILGPKWPHPMYRRSPVRPMGHVFTTLQSRFPQTTQMLLQRRLLSAVGQLLLQEQRQRLNPAGHLQHQKRAQIHRRAQQNDPASRVRTEEHDRDRLLSHQRKRLRLLDRRHGRQDLSRNVGRRNVVRHPSDRRQRIDDGRRSGRRLDRRKSVLGRERSGSDRSFQIERKSEENSHFRGNVVAESNRS
jgi:hypothetical protein